MLDYLVGDCAACKAKDEFIQYLEDQVAELKASLKPEVISKDTPNIDYHKLSMGGYKSNYTKRREAILAMKRKAEVVMEEGYETVEVE